MNQMKVSVYGQFNNDTQHVFTYPAIPDTKVLNPATEWLRSIKDPRTIARQFQLADEAFIMWKAPAGTYYALVAPNKQDNRGGFLQVTLNIGKRVVNSGNALVNALRQLKMLVVDNKSNDPMQVQNILSQLSVSAEKNRYVRPVPPKAAPAKPGAPAAQAPLVIPTAYCDFSSPAELETILENVEMEGVNKFSAVWVVKSSPMTQQVAGLTKLPVLKLRTYTLTDAKTATADKHTVKDGDTITITYKKPGFVDVKQQVVIGPNAKEIKIVGRTIHLMEADEVGISLKRGITIKVLNASTRQTVGSTITIDKKPFESGQQLALNGSKAEFTIEARGYNKEVVRLKQSDVDNGSKTIYLTPAMHEMSLSVYDEQGNRHAGMVQMQGGDLYKFLANNKSRLQAGGSSGDNGMMKLILGLVVGLVLGVGGMVAYNLLPDDEEAKEIIEGVDDDDKGDKDDKDDSGTGDDNSDQSALEAEDLAYMKSKDIWKEEDIKSEKYKNLYNAFKQSGNEGYNNLISVLGQYTDNQTYNGYLKTIHGKLGALSPKDHELMMNRISNKCNKDNAVNLQAITDLIPVQGGARAQTQQPQQQPQQQAQQQARQQVQQQPRQQVQQQPQQQARQQAQQQPQQQNQQRQQQNQQRQQQNQQQPQQQNQSHSQTNGAKMPD